MRRLVYMLALAVYILSAPSVYAFSLGLNVAGRFNDFDRSVSMVGSGGWVSFMGEPNGETLGRITAAQSRGVRVMLRAAHGANLSACTGVNAGACSSSNGPPVSAAYADAWVTFFEANEASFTTPVYFMPLNEPNNAQEGIDLAIAKTYLERLESQLSAKNLRPSPVFLLTPAFDSYNLSGKLSMYYNPLGGSELFNKF